MKNPEFSVNFTDFAMGNKIYTYLVARSSLFSIIKFSISLPIPEKILKDQMPCERAERVQK